MAKLIYVTNTSLDGFIEDRNGAFSLYPHNYDVFEATTKLIQGVGTYLYGRRLYEAMALWETDPTLAAQSAQTAEFAAAWQSAEKIVYSSSLSEVATGRTQLERTLNVGTIRELKATATKDLMIGGANLAAQACDAGLVDECQFLVWPAILGGGKLALPVRTRVDLELVREHRFANGTLHLTYQVLNKG